MHCAAISEALLLRYTLHLRVQYRNSINETACMLSNTSLLIGQLFSFKKQIDFRAIRGGGYAMFVGALKLDSGAVILHF